MKTSTISVEIKDTSKVEKVGHWPIRVDLAGGQYASPSGPPQSDPCLKFNSSKTNEVLYSVIRESNRNTAE